MSWNQQVGKQLNKEIILQQIFVKPHISRNEIIENTTLKKATVSNLVNELIQEQLIVEVGKIASNGGRPSKALQINEVAGYALSIDIGVNYLSGAITNLNGLIIYEIREFINLSQIPNYFNKIIDLIHRLEQNVPPSPYHIIGVAIAVPGIIDVEGKIINAPNLQWRNVDMKALLMPHVDYPIIVTNEANAGVFAEYSYSYNQTNQNLLFVSIGYGIGVGIILNGELFLGDKGYSGESGHMIIQMEGKTCRCGNEGCWEAYASEYAFLHEAQHLLSSPDLTIEDILQLNSNKLEPLYDEISKSISIGLLNLIYTFNPEKVIIGNRITLVQDQIEQKIKNYISNRSSTFLMNEATIEFSTLKDKAIVIGAASLAINNFLLPTLSSSKIKNQFSE